MTSQRRRRRRIGGATAALGLAVLALGGAACSSGAPTASVASLPGHTATTSGTGSAVVGQASGDQQMVDYARCLRQHGVAEPDPVHIPGHNGLSIEIPAPGPRTRPAMNACQHFIAKLIAQKEAGAASQTAPHLHALTDYAQCMRAHDINMLDPTSFGALNLGHVPGMTSDFGRYSPQFRAADAACRHLLPPGVHDDGTGP
jgi:hypothetical protein